ncbi:MAG TPA: nuclear transport factor 2 family protein [Fimbriimonadaceae bacterium]|nr:nuclear transport factor 2 family protein [Fimbriimonadaceae bacterium]
MRLLKSVFVVVALSGALSAALADATVKAAIEKEYARASAALMKRDVKRFMTITTPDIKYYARSRQVLDRNALETQYRKNFSLYRSVDNVAYRVKTVTVNGKTATAMTTSTLDVTLPGGTPKKPMKYRAIADTRNTWVKTPVGWRLQKIELLDDRITLDGRPMLRRAPLATAR